MARIRPFRAWRYDLAHVGDLAKVLTPPYDVIDTAQQHALHARHPANFVHVDLALDHAGDDDATNRYSRAAASWRAWTFGGTMRRDPRPAVYVYHQTFADPNGHHVVRRGFLSLVGLHDYDERVILPHERTLRGPKADRLRLMEATEAQLSQIFLLYDDPSATIDATLASAIAGRAPEVSVTTDDGIHHQLWDVADEELLGRLQDAFDAQQLLIADGHHRYETALAYRDTVRARNPGAEDGPWDYALAYLANGADPTLLVLPTHRAMHGLSSFDAAAFLDRAAAWFTVTPLGMDTTPRGVEEALAAAGQNAPSFAALFPDGRAALLTLNTTAAATRLAEIPGPEVARELDVVVLHELLIGDVLGVTREAQEARTNIEYIKGRDAAFTASRTAPHQVTFLMNATPVSRVRAMCLAGGFMPQKSTFFYPKVASGLVVSDLAEF